MQKGAFLLGDVRDLLSLSDRTVQVASDLFSPVLMMHDPTPLPADGI